MGCGSSVAYQPNKLNRNVQFDEIMGKLIPQHVIETSISKQSSSRFSIKPKEELSDEPKRDKIFIKKRIRGEVDMHDMLENFTRVKRELTKLDIELIKHSLKGHFVFYNLSIDAVANLTQQMFYCTSQTYQFIFKEGDHANFCFILDSGEVEVMVDEQVVRTLKKGDAFGEIALLYNAPRSASVRANKITSFWAINRATFRSTIESLTSKEFEENILFLDQIAFFEFITSHQRNIIARNLLTTKFKKGQYIVNEGERADSCHMIKEGQVSIWHNYKMIAKMGPQDSFGELTLYISSTRSISAKSDTEVKCGALSGEMLVQIFGENVQKMIFNNLIRWCFQKSEILALFTMLQVERIVQDARISNYLAGSIVLNKGHISDKLIIILEGSLICEDTNEIYTKGSYVGDVHLQKEQKPILLTSNFKMESDGILAVFNINQILRTIKGDYETVISRNENSHERKMFCPVDKVDSSDIKMEDLIYISRLGQGHFGWVCLVKPKQDDSSLYALKRISKAIIIEQNLEQHMLQEQAVLQMTNFPFIMKLIKTFQDDASIFFLVEYIKGIEMFNAMREMGLMKKYETQFYVGTMILTIEYLHQQGFVYRDLKPENLMIDQTGYMYVIDLGTAKPLSIQKSEHTFTLIGTPHYMAPEVILGKGYSFNVDLWSIGVCMFEFISGKVPYAEDQEDPYAIYEEIMKTRVRFPEFVKDDAIKQLIVQLLSKQPEVRLGGSFANLKANKWFEEFDWDKLFSKELTPPFIPNPSKMISDTEIHKNFLVGQTVMDMNMQTLSTIKSKKISKTPDWDANF